MQRNLVIEPTQENIDIVNEIDECCGRKRGFYATAYNAYAFGLAFSIEYHPTLRDFCILIHVLVFDICIGFDFYRKPTQEDTSND